MMKDTDFVDYINKYDMCFLTETWLTKKITVDNFYVDCLPAVKIKERFEQGRYSGG